MGVEDTFISPITGCINPSAPWPSINEPGLPSLLAANFAAFMAGIDYVKGFMPPSPFNLPKPPSPQIFIDAFMKAVHIPFPSMPTIPVVPSITVNPILTGPLIPPVSPSTFYILPAGSTSLEASGLSIIPKYPFSAAIDDENINLVSGNPVTGIAILSSPTNDDHIIGTLAQPNGGKELVPALAIGMPPYPVITNPLLPFKNLEEYIAYVTAFINLMMKMVMVPFDIIIGIIASFPAIQVPTEEAIINLLKKAFSEAGFVVPDPNYKIPEHPDPNIPIPPRPVIPMPALEKLAGCMGMAVRSIIPF